MKKILLILFIILFAAAAHAQVAQESGASGDVYFEKGSAALSAEARKGLDALAVRLKGRPQAGAMMAGYSEPGEPSGVAWQRAVAAKDYLVSRGIPPERISIISFAGKDLAPEKGLKGNARVRYRTTEGGFKMPGGTGGGVCQKCKDGARGGNK